MAKKQTYFQVGICPDCSDTTSQQYIWGVNQCSPLQVDRGKPHVYGNVHTISLFQCDGCRSIVIYTTYYADAVDIDEAEKLDPKWIFDRDDLEDGNDFRIGTYTSLLHPTRQMATEPFEPAQLAFRPAERKLPDYTPDSINECYAEALKVREHPRSFAGQIRRALEEICKNKGLPCKNLNQDLKKLSELGIFPPLVADITNEIKDIGNAAVHVRPRQRRKVGHKEVQAIDDFFHLVVTYVYFAPALLKAHRKRLRPKAPKIISEDTVH